MKNKSITTKTDLQEKERKIEEQKKQANRETMFYKIISRTSFYKPWQIK